MVREPASGVSDDGGITLNFVDADVRDIAKAVLGDFLGLNYSVGANVAGTITIQTSRPVPRADALPVLEQALQLNGLALIKRANVYNIVPLADARHQTGAIGSPHHATGEPGFGVQIVPLKYIGAVQMQHLLEPLVPSQAVVYADASRNFLVIQGSEAERAAMVEEIGLFDVDRHARGSRELCSDGSCVHRTIASAAVHADVMLQQDRLGPLGPGLGHDWPAAAEGHHITIY